MGLVDNNRIDLKALHYETFVNGYLNDYQRHNDGEMMLSSTCFVFEEKNCNRLSVDDKDWNSLLRYDEGMTKVLQHE